MGDKTKEELASEARRLARIHKEVAERLRNGPHFIYDDADDGEAISLVGGIDLPLGVEAHASREEVKIDHGLGVPRVPVLRRRG
jgi:hypothetical protein